MSVGNNISGRLGATLLTMLLLAVPSLAATAHKTKHRKSTSPKTATVKTATSAAAKSSSKAHLKRTRRGRGWKHHGQQAVDARRTQQIQQALIQSHYLDGKPSGAWDTKTQEALRRYQAANGWQSKVVPDSRALIKLGLGPSNDKLLNPESAMTSHIETRPAVTPEAMADPNTPR